MATEILSPSYQHSPLVTYHLGGTELVLRLPQHNNEFESTLAPSNTDIFDAHLYQQGFQPLPYLMLVKSSWTYRFANSPIDAGSVILGIAVTHCLGEKEVDYNFLDRTSFSQWVLDRLHKIYAPLVEEEIEELKTNDLPILEDKMWRYPRKESDLVIFEKCDIHWCLGRTGHPSIAEYDPIMFVPINRNYALEISTSFGGFNPEYFDSAETIETIKEALLQEFLEHVQVTYSSEILAKIRKP